MDRYVGASEAVIKAARGKRLIAQSTLPLRARSASGALAPVDLQLVDRGSSLEPQTPLVSTRIAKRLGEGVAFPQEGYGLHLVAPQSPVAQTTAGKAFYANADRDSDALIAPTPRGVDVSLMLRSVKSPERMVLAFDLPSGMRLKADGSGTVQVMRGETPVAFIPPAAALDADHQPVSTSYTVQGNQLVVRVAHRQHDVRYPILVDPVVDNYALLNSNKVDYSPGAFNGWAFLSNFNPYFNYYFNGNQGTGLYVTDWANGTYQGGPNNTPGHIGEWYRQAPANSYIQRADFYQDTYLDWGMCAWQGIYSASAQSWEAGYWNWIYDNSPRGPSATYTTCTSEPNIYRAHTATGPTTNNLAIFGMVAFGNGPYGNGYRPGGPYWMYSSGQTLYLNDNNNPYFTGGNLSNYSAGWVDRSVTGVSVSAHDIGLGVSLFQLLTPDTTGRYNSPSQLYGLGCTGDHKTPCPADATGYFGYDTNTMPEGTDTVIAAVYDAVAHGANSTWPVKVDRSPPTTTPSGSLWDHRNQASDHRNEGLYDPAYNLHIDGSDPYSGVKSIEVFVDGQSQASHGGSANGTCSITGCGHSASLDWTLNADSYADGDHTITIVTKDQLADQPGIDLARHTTTTTIPVTIDRHGDVYSAALYDGDPSTGGTLLSNEVGQLGTPNARRFDTDGIVTRHAVTCSHDPSGQCGEVREVIRSDETDGPDDQPGDTYHVVAGTSEGDTRLDIVASMLGPMNSALGSPTSTGPLNDALSSWQTAPPGHGAAYALYETTTPDTVDGTATDATQRTWIDQTTKLPLRTSTVVAGESESDMYYTYGRGRQTTSELPADEFAVSKPANTVRESSVDYADGSPDLANHSQPPTEDEEVAHAKAFREAFGLKADDAFIRNTLNDPSLTPSIDTYGLPLTVPEVADMTLRGTVEAALKIIDDFGRTVAPDSYAGIYIDQQHGGLVHVGFTKNADQALSALRTVFPYPDLLRAYPVPPTLTLPQLDALQNRVSDDVDTLNADGFDVTSVSENEQGNTIDIGVPTPTPELRAKVAARYGNAAVRLVEQSPMHPLADRASGNGVPPLFGGLKVPSNGGMCSSGFSVHRGGRYYMVTAGHCSAKGDEFYYDTTTLGTVKRRLFPAPGHHSVGDVELVGLPRRYATSRVLTNPPNHHIRITRAAGPDEGQVKDRQHPGTMLCVAGWPKIKGSYKAVCGLVLSNPDFTLKQCFSNLDGTPDCSHAYYIDHVKQALGTIVEGFSGAPVYDPRRHTAYGTVVTGGEDDQHRNVVQFTPIATVLRKFKVSLVVGTR